MSVWDGGFHDAPEDEREQQWEDSDDLEDEDAPWRGDTHLDNWPESLAGPEYWLYRDELDGEEGGP